MSVNRVKKETGFICTNLHVDLLVCVYLCSTLPAVISVTISADCTNNRLGDSCEHFKVRSEARNCTLKNSTSLGGKPIPD